MKRIYQTILILVLVFCASASALAQEVYVPKNYKLEDISDYRSHQPAVQKCFRWLLDTPLHENVETRAEANAFVMQWLAGTPTITIEIDSDLLVFAKKNEELFYTFIHAITLYNLEHEQVKGYEDVEFALREVVKMHRKSKGLVKDDAIRELKKASRWGRLDDWIRERLN